VVTRVATQTVTGAVYDIRVTGVGAIAVGDGVFAGDVTRDEAPVIRTSGGGGCFVAGTPVLTASGAVSIEQVGSGDQVWAWNPVARSWALQDVARLLVREYSGDIVEIRASGSVLTATGNHPFWVEAGDGLHSRPLAEDLGGSSILTGVSGRWVSARDLRVGDELVTRSGVTVLQSVRTIAAHASRTVYNLAVAGNHTYAVGSAGIAVHNKGEAESPESATASEEEFGGIGETRGSLRSSDAARDDPDWVVEDDGSAPDPAVPADVPRTATDERARAAESGLSAGYSDDNQEFGAFLRFLEDYGSSAPHIPIEVNERIIFTVLDSDGKTVPNATISVSSGREVLAEGRTYSDGHFLFFPAEHGSQRSYSVDIHYGGRTQSVQVDRQGVRDVQITLPRPRRAMQQVPLDVLFVLDTTGSMGEEIARLTQSIEIIHLNLTSLSTNPLVRFGMVLYKDRGDEYTTRTVALTPDIDLFQSELEKVYASGGGDYPEDLQEALGAATRQIDWDPDGVRLVFVITDAPPQFYPDQTYTYADAARTARRDGIRIYTVGTGGMDIQGEYPLRQLSQYTGARYIFLTYGESGESAGGTPGSVSHHTGANYETGKLEAIIIRFAKDELQYLTDAPVEIAEPYFTAVPISTEERDATLRALFSSAVAQLLAYSSWEIPPAAPTAVVPFHVADDGMAVQAEYLSEQLLLTMRQDATARAAFTLVERRDMQSILEEIEFQLSGLTDSSSVTRVGEFLGAQLLISGSLYEGADDYELFVRLLRVETGEVLAVTKAIIDRGLVP
jgi:Mg-chelatase subunit ChlD